ncbi:MAG: hypothetical protein HZB30_07365 [Nitrospirae bacterium]|nr:hypothetical protein [Nitrospirota bacterium]
MKIIFLIFVSSIIYINNFADASNFGIGVHSGYGVLKYEEHTSTLGTDRKSDASLNTLLLGASGEYSFTKFDNLYAGITTDFAIGTKDREKWKDNGSESQTNDIRVFGQFYDFRLGYKNNIDEFYYRAYISGGWDGIRFTRDNFSASGKVINGETTEDFSLWRMGGGLGFGYKFNKWALDGRAAYSYYPDGKVTNSDYDGLTFDTNGTCLDLGVGIGRAITNNIGFYMGGFYTLIILDESEVKRAVSKTTTRIVFPDSRTELMGGVVNLTYAF